MTGLTAEHVSDDIGARTLPRDLPNVDWFLGDRGYDAEGFREALQDKRIRACIAGSQTTQDRREIRQASLQTTNRIEIMFGRSKDWRRVATRYDRRPKVFLSAIALAATVIYWQ